MVEAAKSGVSVLSLCEKGDAMIMEETGKIFKKEKDMKKGNKIALKLYFWYADHTSLFNTAECVHC